jgi:hypothetical protein
MEKVKNIGGELTRMTADQPENSKQVTNQQWFF